MTDHGPQKQPASSDGIYRYRWESRFGKHSVFFDVTDGIIQENEASEMSPIKAFEGRTIDELHVARARSDWRFRDDSLHQFTSGHYSPPTKG